MELITPIISSLGGIIGVAKNFLELRIAIKDLFKKDIQLNSAFGELSKRDEKALTDLYKAIEIGKDLTGRIYKKLAIKYSVTLIIFLILMVAGLYVSQPVFTSLPTLVIIGISIAPYFLVTSVFPVPIKFNAEFLGGKINEMIEDYKKGSLNISANFNNKIYKLRRVVGFISWMAPNENKYLEHYLDLCSLKDTIEMYWIDKKIENAKTYIFETVQFRQTFEDTLADIIEDILVYNGQIAKNVDKITNQIKSSGLERFLILFDDKFFQKDFQQQYDLYKKNGIKQIINEYW